jgi:hypothetical protein
MQPELENEQPTQTAWTTAGIWHSPCRNDALPCKDLAIAPPEYDS